VEKIYFNREAGQLSIPLIQKTNHSNRMNWFPVNRKPLTGRPIVVLKKFIDLGFEEKFFSKDLVNKVIEHGFDRGYWSDARVLSEPFAYFLSEKFYQRHKRLKELEER